MRQLLLDLDAQKLPSLTTFVVGQNAELAQLLDLFSQRIASQYGERSVYLWGQAGAGKTHLLHALADDGAARYIPFNAPESAFDFSEEVSLYLIDDCDLLSPLNQIAAFNLFNEARAHGGFLIAAGNHPPMILTVRDDLRTRLGWGLIYQLHGLTDEDKIDALERSAHARGIQLSAGVLPYLITHYQRDMSSLSAMLDHLDHYSLVTKRPITLPLLRELMLQQQP
ncbi:MULTISPECIES: DnaA regulatory inactivator Hda [unclassified Undibacterium]|uniref:DnaA regulatory inactivator Hda n=1 Tax=unclassified Undibacterium TaxID=2630295 RepID=UPI002AC9E568|nr:MULTISPECIES: DnaA regulatory inactivator Hda [unclassified Undibacterium]MEB0139922.1 DnaA regulatory inactivator Hda [Undibacterium sp. CCC2.1]MEB0171809.1 DnaA regulatory inactivator Hda [Undibacterium sp. CCC1.1]MEB0175625.1 DnaA regulatory inactivator Hda [Undibacterium sp. CCC3.4]MEB0216207.1 DnaA regulatory inactivator Hda [Undibacterium sp. 5I2]WPX44100.1 DnaA regulatory inactivator Hda [Undibacterium sp. CCC3.4]